MKPPSLLRQIWDGLVWIWAVVCIMFTYIVRQFIARFSLFIMSFLILTGIYLGVSMTHRFSPKIGIASCLIYIFCVALLVFFYKRTVGKHQQEIKS